MPETTVAGAARITRYISFDDVVSQTIKLVRDALRVNVEDPIARGDEWILNQFPRRPVTYPLIILAHPTMLKDPMGNSNTKIEEGIISTEIIVYSKFTLERDEITDEVLALMKSKRNDFRDMGLFDARITSCYDAEFDDTNEVFRKIIVIQFGIVG